MNNQQRMLSRIAGIGDAKFHRRAAVQRFNHLVVVRRSWGFAFVARVAGVFDVRYIP